MLKSILFNTFLGNLLTEFSNPVVVLDRLGGGRGVVGGCEQIFSVRLG